MTIFASRLRSFFSGNKFADTLQTYFRSGWAFLIPYLAAYLLYAWTKWPVNAATAGSTEQGVRSWVPCLLHVYWVLHAIHVVLGIIALRAWWRRDGEERGAKGEAPELGIRPPRTVHRLPETVYRLLPWIFLGLLFYIPGIYLEWPSDPWAHWGRVNEWSWHETVLDHSSWKKSSYFLPYSLTGHITGLLQLSWLNFYYTAVCLLLSWQYYRLARAVGLSEHSSFILVLLNALTFGNNIFSFYRYYGLSSSIFAQLGAVGLTRIALEALQGKPENGDRRLETAATDPLGTDLPLTFSHSQSVSATISRLPPPVTGLIQLTGAGIFLLPLIVFNHVQGIGIAGLGVLAVVVWRLIEWKRAMFGYLALAAAVLSIAAIIWLPRHSSIAATYGPDGWLSSWQGFALFSPTSPAFERTVQITGAFGLLNLAAGLWLLRRNHVAGWLIVMPFLLLSLPIVTLPFLNLLLHADQLPLVFHRLLFAVPVGLGILLVVRQIWKYTPSRWRHPGLWWCLTLVLLSLVVLQPENPIYNRLFNALQNVPGDLTSHLPGFAAKQPLASVSSGGSPRAGLFSFNDTAYRLRMAGVDRSQVTDRTFGFTTPAANAESTITQLSGSSTALVAVLPKPTAAYTPFSFNGVLSKHWLSWQAALGLVGYAEIRSVAQLLSTTAQQQENFVVYTIGASYMPLEAYGSLLMSPIGQTVTPSITLPLLQTRNVMIQLCGHHISGSASIALDHGSIRKLTEPVDREFRLWTVSGDAPVKLEFNPAGGFVYEFSSLTVRESITSTTALPISGSPGPFPPHSKGEIISNIRFSASKAPAGLFVMLHFDPTQDYLVEVRGSAGSVPPTLRIDNLSAEEPRLQYLSLAGQGVRFLVQRHSQLRLLIYQDSPFSYDLHSLSVTHLSKAHYSPHQIIPVFEQGADPTFYQIQH